MVFLLRHQPESKGGSSFYDFLPYKYGPFSFALYQEMGKLQEQSYVLSEDDQPWTLNPRLADAVSALGGAVERDVKTVVEHFDRFTGDELLDYVSDRYPAYTVNSERRGVVACPRAQPAVFTAGYEGLSIDRFLNLLVVEGLERLIDVRNNPVLRRFGFHKTTLSKLANRLEIEYFHFPQLGIESAKRQHSPAVCC